jgi:hypothetical protein
MCIHIITCSFFTSSIFAQTISYSEAEQYIVENAYSTQAQRALQQSAQLEMDAIKILGSPVLI